MIATAIDTEGGVFMKPSFIAILKCVAEHGQCSARQIAEHFPDSAARSIERIASILEVRGYLDCETAGDRRLVNLYTTSDVGRRFLASLCEPERATGNVPAPRGPIPSEPWKPKPFTPARAGATDFLRAQSRRGDALVDHAPPISMAGGGNAYAY